MADLDKLIAEAEARAIAKAQRAQAKKKAKKKAMPKKKALPKKGRTRTPEAAAHMRERRITKPPEQEDDEELVNRALTTPAPGTRQYARLTKPQTEERRRKFARAYFESNFDPRIGCLAAGWKYRRENMPRILAEPVVIDELERLKRIARGQIDAKAFDVTNGWLELASSNMMDFVEQEPNGTVKVRADLMALPEYKQRQIKKLRVQRKIYRRDNEVEQETIDTEIELYDKTKALDALSKVEGLYKDKMGDAAADFIGLLASRLNHMAEQTGRQIAAPHVIEGQKIDSAKEI